MIFVDTSARYQVFTPTDAASTVASNWFQNNTAPLVTSDFIIDELFTLLRARHETHRALVAGEALFSGQLAQVEHVTPSDIVAAWEMFKRYNDKSWSFTDCTSFALVERLKIDAAFALDEHFNQFGKLVVHPT